MEGRCVDRHTHQEFLAFLKHLYRKFPRKQLYVIVDNFNAHKHEKVREWAAKRRRLTLHFTPTYASWLNQVEIWFNIFSPDVIRGGIWHSKKELIDHIMLYIRKYNEEQAHPFITQAIKLFSLSSTEAPKKLIWGAQDWEPLIGLSNKWTYTGKPLAA